MKKLISADLTPTILFGAGVVGTVVIASRATLSRRRSRGARFYEIILGTRGEAQEVLDQLYTLISEHDVATVADLYEMVDQPGTFTDWKWGWAELRGADITRVKGGYLLDLPRPEYID